jgi:formylglycine-generating enzyme required for sulfatase activity
LLWDTGNDPSIIKNRRKNLSSVKSSLNADLKKLYREGMNPDGVSIGPAYVFVMSDEAKDKALKAFIDSGQTDEPVNLGAITQALNLVDQMLSKPEALSDREDSEGSTKLDELKNLIHGLSEKVGAGGPGLTESGPEAFQAALVGEGVEYIEGVAEDEVIEDLEDAETDEVLAREEVEEEIDSIETDEDFEEVEADEVLEDVEIDEAPELNEIDDEIKEIDMADGLDDIHAFDANINDDVEGGIEGGEILGGLGREDGQTGQLERGSSGDGHETDDIISEDAGLSKGAIAGQMINSDGLQGVEEFAGLVEEDMAEDVKDVAIDEVLDSEEVEEEIDSIETDEDLEQVEADEVLEDVEVDEDPELSEIEEPAEEGTLEGIEDVLAEDEYEGDDEMRKARLLAEEFNDSLAAMDKFYNQYILVPGGEYIVGNKQPNKDERPEQIVALSPFYMGKFPVTNGLFEIFVEKTGYKTTAEKLGYGTVFYGRCQKTVDEITGMEKCVWNSALINKTVKGACWYQPLGPGSVLNNKKKHPVVQISLEDAMAFAAWTGKRLPTGNEWEAASRTANGYVFPWGNDWQRDTSNTEESYIGDTTPVDRYMEFENGFGIVDTIGNVLEWTTDCSGPPSSLKNGPVFIVKGGSWISANNVRLSTCFKLEPEFHSNILGFRCVAY